MSAPNSFKIPINHFNIGFDVQQRYPNLSLPFGANTVYTTQVSPRVLKIRIIGALIFTGLTAVFVAHLNKRLKLKTNLNVRMATLVFPVVALGTLYVLWTIYLHKWKTDPLLGVFNKIFESCPITDLRQMFLSNPGQSLTDRIQELNRSSLPVLSTARTEEGQNIILVKCYSQDENQSILMVFIEKLGAEVLFSRTQNSFMLTIYDAANAVFRPFSGNTTSPETIHFETSYASDSISSGQRQQSLSSTRSKIIIQPYITSKMANELYAQLRV